ncbi:THUMP domain-containing protein, partial [Nanoarchaeota archaeon]
MKGLAITQLGIENVTASEIKDLIGSDCKVNDSCITFSCSQKDLCLLCYKAQSVVKVLELLGEFKFSSFDVAVEIAFVAFFFNFNIP